MKKIIVLILLVALVPAYLFYQKSNEKVEEPTKEMAGEVNKGVPKEVSEKAAKEAAEEANPTTVVAMYSLADVEKHNTKEDCWLAIEGKVYDVTSFVSSGKHPGGEAILEGCGKDATTLFNTRPMGSGTPHSDKARSGLVNFIIGDLSK